MTCENADEGHEAPTHNHPAPMPQGTRSSEDVERAESTKSESRLERIDSLLSNATSLPSLRWRERVKHFTWTWFTMTMATGGIANDLSHVPFKFSGLYAIGTIFFILNLCLFIFNCGMMTARAIMWPKNFRSSFLHPTESLFIPAFFISIAVILDNVTQYGLAYGKTGSWLVTTMIVAYWTYIVVAVAASCGIYLLMWSTQVFTIGAMTPAWIFPAYPMLLVAPIAASLTRSDGGAKGNQGLAIIIGGTIVQGAGYCVSFMVYSAFLYRLMTQKLPAESSRPSMFISVGPSAFTVGGLIRMANNFPRMLGPDFMGNGPLTGQIVKIMGYWVGLWLYGISVWFFIVSVGAHWTCIRDNRLQFSMTWMGFIFPNSALTSSTFAVAEALGYNKPISIVACVMVCLLIALWLYIMGMLIRAIALKHILWPEKQEDSDYDSWKSELKARRLREARAEQRFQTEQAHAHSVGSAEHSVFARSRTAPVRSEHAANAV